MLLSASQFEVQLFFLVDLSISEISPDCDFFGSVKYAPTVLKSVAIQTVEIWTMQEICRTETEMNFFHNTVRPATMSKRSVDHMHNRDIADATGPQRQETTTKVARLESNDTTTACAYDKCKKKCKQSLEARVSPVSDKHSQVLPVTLTNNRKRTPLCLRVWKDILHFACASRLKPLHVSRSISLRVLSKTGVYAPGAVDMTCLSHSTLPQ